MAWDGWELSFELEFNFNGDSSFFFGGGGKGGGLSRRPDIDILKSLEDAVKQLTNSIQRH